MEMATHASNSTTTAKLLNEIPDDPLLHILSFLPTQEAVETSLISRRFRHLWCSLPNLSLSHHHFSLPNKPLASTCHSFMQLLDRIFFHRSFSSPLHKFHLQFRLAKEKHDVSVTTWISLAIAHGVMELDLDFADNEGRWDVNYDFPFALLRASEVSVLKLRHSDVSLNCSLYGIQFVSLRSMLFSYVTLRDEVLSDLILGCINLESLTIESCFGIQNVKICSSKLKQLSLISFQQVDSDNDDTSTSLEIVAPSLNVLHIVFFGVDTYVFKDVMSLVEADIILPFWDYSKVIKSVVHVIRLHVFNYWFQLLKVMDFFPKSTILFNLRYLHMITGYSKSDLLGLAAFLELTPNLDTMILDRALQFVGIETIILDEVIDEQINFNLPSLRQVTMKYCGEPQNELYLMKLLQQQGVVLEKIELIPVRR